MCLDGDFASGAAEQTKPGCDVWRPIKPAESSRLCSLSAWHRLGPRARRAKQATTVTMAFRGRRWCSTCQCVAPAGPASPTGSGGCRATSFHPWFFFSSFFLRGSGTVGNMIPETATEQSILEISSRSSKCEPKQQSFPGPAKPLPEQLPRGVIETAA